MIDETAAVKADIATTAIGARMSVARDTSWVRRASRLARNLGVSIPTLYRWVPASALS
jgi:hypothetical protein